MKKSKKLSGKTKKRVQPKPVQSRSKAARAHIAEGTRLFALAGRPTQAQFVTEQRAKTGIDAKHFQAALAAKGGA
jgi:hypothetical protein